MHTINSVPSEREAGPVPPDPEVPARQAKRRFTTAYKLDVLRRADACTRPGELGALADGRALLVPLVTWRRQREHDLTPKKRGRKARLVDPKMKQLEHENRRLARRLQRADAIMAFQEQVAELLGSP